MTRAFYILPATVAMLLLPILSAQVNPGPLPKEYSFKVDARDPWNDTRLDLQAGERVHINGPLITCGGPSRGEKLDLPLPSAPGGALLFKMHLDDPPMAATPDAEIPVMNPSHLYLGVNGVNCTGTLPVKVRVEKNPQASSSPTGGAEKAPQ
jgi:hypothetical protein